MFKKLLSLLLALLLVFTLAFAYTGEVLVDGESAMTEDVFVEWGYDYFSPEEVALYLHAFGELPPNFITKDEARDMGWDRSPGSLWEIGYGFCIGGDVFGNREGLLPDEDWRTWYECDVNYDGWERGAERLVFSTDGLIYYTGDHYESFELMYENWYEPDYLYGEEYSEEESWWNWGW